MRIVVFGVLVAALIAACDDGDDSCPAHLGTACVEREVRACYDRAPTIDQGMYGCMAAFGDDLPAPPGEAVDDEPVVLFVDAQGTVRSGSTRTDEMGFYQIMLQAGTYYYCTGVLGGPHCIEVPLSVDTVVAVDASITPLTNWAIRDAE